MDGVRLTEIVEKMNLKNLTPGWILPSVRFMYRMSTDRLFATDGLFDHFDLNRVQIIGNVECAYLETLTREKR